MKAVFIVDKSKIAKVLIDPMRRAILNLLRQKPMTQTQLANELGLSPPSLSYHIKLLKSINLVVIAKKQVESHGITQIFYSSVAYFFVYDLDSLPRDIGRYFYPLSLERARAVVSVLLLKNKSFKIEQTPDGINRVSRELSRIITNVARPFTARDVLQGRETVAFEIYLKSVQLLLRNVKSNKKFPLMTS